MKHYTRQAFLLLPIVLLTINKSNCDKISINKHDISIKLNSTQNILIGVKNHTEGTKKLLFSVQHPDILQYTPKTLNINGNGNYPIKIKGIGAGHSHFQVTNITGQKLDVSKLFVRVTVFKYDFLDKLSLIIGWLYFIAWSVSFYPQVIENFKRKSVAGLNMDFVILNLIGFALYSVFNLGLYYIPCIQREYSARYPRGLNPVQLNDLVFSLHALIITAITLIQCFIYKKEDQNISISARVILGLFGAFLGISLIVSAAKVIHWLDFLYFCSYVKLIITLIKYIPQAYHNFKRKSTVGWSIWNVLLDFTGGILSMLQMIMISVNYDDWVSIFGDPTKFGLGLFSVVFDIFFIFQHYVLYKDTTYDTEEEGSSVSS